MSLLQEKIKLDIQEAELHLEKKLSSFPPVLKGILIICLLSLIPGYFLAKQISYSTTKKSLNSQLLTAQPSFQNPLTPKVEKVEVFNWTGNVYSVLATVNNPNFELSAPNVHYKFKFFNSSNTQVTPESGLTEGDTYFLPNKTQTIVLPRITSTRKISRAEIEFTGTIGWQKKLNLPQAKIITTFPSLKNSNDPFEFKVTGFVENQSIYELGRVRILLLIKDKTGKILSLSERSEFSLKNGERRSYTQIWPNVNFLNAAYIEAVADTDTLNIENLIIPIGGVKTDSSLDRPSKSEY